MTRPADGYELTLFVSGASELSANAVLSARALCEVQLGGHGHLQVVDVQRDSAAASARGVLVTPTLVRTGPLPVRQLVGDLSDTARVLRVLGLEDGP